jgi:hypothetical protein
VVAARIAASFVFASAPFQAVRSRVARQVGEHELVIYRFAWRQGERVNGFPGSGRHVQRDGGIADAQLVVGDGEPAQAAVQVIAFYLVAIIRAQRTQGTATSNCFNSMGDLGGSCVRGQCNGIRSRSISLTRVQAGVQIWCVLLDRLLWEWFLRLDRLG